MSEIKWGEVNREEIKQNKTKQNRTKSKPKQKTKNKKQKRKKKKEKTKNKKQKTKNKKQKTKNKKNTITKCSETQLNEEKITCCINDISSLFFTKSMGNGAMSGVRSHFIDTLRSEVDVKKMRNLSMIFHQ